LEEEGRCVFLVPVSVSVTSALVNFQKLVDGVLLEVHITGRLPWPSKPQSISEVTRNEPPQPPFLDTATATSEAAPSSTAPPSESPSSTTHSSTSPCAPDAPSCHAQSSTLLPGDIAACHDTAASSTVSTTQSNCSNPSACPIPSSSAQPNAMSPDAQPSTVPTSSSEPTACVVELSPMSAYMPLVELYTQVGTQVGHVIVT
jgi:hypothetical protein